jgi:putative tricarboxylic transport membrane protein
LNHENQEPEASDEPTLGTRGPADSIRVGTGWGEDGPRSGYFPFYIGALLLAASGWTFVTSLLKGRGEAFATRSQLKSVMQVLLPMVVYVGVMAWTGLYLASAALIAWFMRRHGRYGWALTAAVAIGVPLLAFMVFERWFLVPLPKGHIETALGF